MVRWKNLDIKIARLTSFSFGRIIEASPARSRGFQGLKLVRLCSTCRKLHFGTSFMNFGVKTKKI